VAGIAETEVFVVGAGPVGLSMAIALRRFGLDCIVVEKHASTLDFPRGRGVTVRTMEIMRRWGLEDALVAAGLPRSESLAVFNGESLLAAEFERVELPAPGPSALSPTRPLICDQLDMEVVLREAAVAAGADVRFGWELTDVAGHGDTVAAAVVERASGREHALGASWVVAADGAHSPMRERLGIDRHGAGVVGAAVSILIEANLGDRMTDRGSALYRLRGLPGGTLAAVDNDRRWLLIYGYNPAEHPAESFTEARFRELALAAIGDPSVDVAIVGHRYWQPTALVSDRYRQGRIFLAGDAAHVCTPIGGLGMNCGIADVDNLAWKLAGVTSGWAGQALVDTYQPERRPVAELTAQASLGRARPPAGVDGLLLGTTYESAAICADGTKPPAPADPIAEYVPVARPGHRAPTCGSTKATHVRRSIFSATPLFCSPPPTERRGAPQRRPQRAFLCRRTRSPTADGPNSTESIHGARCSSDPTDTSPGGQCTNQQNQPSSARRSSPHSDMLD
jgi:2-polyprenyl-6-methoxyphenol hydroxylase-like FAD-dependent oxidoreductase